MDPKHYSKILNEYQNSLVRARKEKLGRSRINRDPGKDIMELDPIRNVFGELDTKMNEVWLNVEKGKPNKQTLAKIKDVTEGIKTFDSYLSVTPLASQLTPYKVKLQKIKDKIKEHYLNDTPVYEEPTSQDILDSLGI
ncbi:hypothetical protein D3C87_1117290 [compost metagenome]